MTTDNKQPVLTDDEIEALAKKHLAPNADQLEAAFPGLPPYRETTQFSRVKNLIAEVLSTRRVADGPSDDDLTAAYLGGEQSEKESQRRGGDVDERAAFEASVKIALTKRVGDEAAHFGMYEGEYDSDFTHCAFIGWQAARGSKGAEADPLQGAADWLVRAITAPTPADIQRNLIIGYNRSRRLYDAAIAQQGKGEGRAS